MYVNPINRTYISKPTPKQVDEEVDPLDAFMAGIDTQIQTNKQKQNKSKAQVHIFLSPTALTDLLNVTINTNNGIVIICMYVCNPMNDQTKSPHLSRSIRRK